MDDLEEKRLKILQELQDGNSNSNSNSNLLDSSSNSNLTESTSSNGQSSGRTEALSLKIKEDNEEKDKCSITKEEVKNSESGTEESQDEDNSLKITHKKLKKNHHRSKSKGFELGATIPGSVTPYAVLPPSDKWTVDVTDHILFENLPDALGTWTKMRGLMSRVKNKMENLHENDE
ncbi:unnamed protein product [Meganyctiphanes norvegica]|uniref:Uncharacterized protein n=1 Tax=Meganyctiphanes norvegica TaxID=48144 RepID=A0AAV2QFW3_MEGNR